MYRRGKTIALSRLLVVPMGLASGLRDVHIFHADIALHKSI
jgi:hypothetical protein